MRLKTYKRRAFNMFDNDCGPTANQQLASVNGQEERPTPFTWVHSDIQQKCMNFNVCIFGGNAGYQISKIVQICLSPYPVSQGFIPSPTWIPLKALSPCSVICSLWKSCHGSTTVCVITCLFFCRFFSLFCMFNCSTFMVNKRTMLAWTEMDKRQRKQTLTHNCSQL